MRNLLLLACALALVPRASAAQTVAADSAAIRQAALDYIEGWYEADAARMARAVHPELAKRVVITDQSGQTLVRGMGASELVAQTRRGGGSEIPADQRRRDVEILDVYGNMAAVKVTSARLVDYMHLAKSEGQWKIINVLWDRRAPDGQASRPPQP